MEQRAEVTELVRGRNRCESEYGQMLRSSAATIPLLGSPYNFLALAVDKSPSVCFLIVSYSDSRSRETPFLPAGIPAVRTQFQLCCGFRGHLQRGPLPPGQ